MRKLMFWLLSVLVFSIPWDQFFVAFGFSSLSRLLGAAALATGVLTVAVSGRLQRPGAVLFLAAAFTMSSLLSLLWTIAPGETIDRVLTYVQLLGVVWLVREFIHTREEHQSLMLAYCLGGYVCIVDLMNRFIFGQEFGAYRYSAGYANPNDLGLTLALGVPMAWQLFLNRRGTIRILAATYLPLAALAILLTASRGAFVALIVASSIVPLTLRGRSFRSVILMVALLLVTVELATLIVPQYNWDRVLSTAEEARSGTMSRRTDIWSAGLQIFRENPLLGVGAGAFGAAIGPFIENQTSAHNAYIAVLVEQGVIGFFVFAGLLAACVHCVYHLPQPDRKVWAVLGLAWLVGVMSGAWQYHKVTWLLFGLMAAQGTAKAASRRLSLPREWVSANLPPPSLLPPVDSRPIVKQTASR
jgi:O-antigen ligase